MRIETVNYDKMVQTGSFLLKAIMNKSTPILDLLVRESIQNSLDAALPNAEYVKVNYLIGSFDRKALNSELEGVTHSLNSAYPNSYYDFLAIKDTNTYGLTGEVDPLLLQKNQDKGNFFKLVYSLGQAQSAEGAGGSWGLGKSIYYRIGNGLVIYYSRIKKGIGYESRMAACMVEDEKKSNLTPSSCGIAFWGDRVKDGNGENKTKPLTNEESIRRFLDIFGITPFQNEETGTIVIIPYISKEKLLKNNSYNIQTENLYWADNVEEYIKIAAQRWYFPRLNNREYPYGKPLQVFVNNQRIKKDEMVPLFRIYQCLYNRAATNEYCIPDDDYILEKEISTDNSIYINNKIILHNSLINTSAGRLVAIKVKAEDMGINHGYRKPHEYAQILGEEDDNNLPLLTFCRKPGMLVAYRSSGHWLKGVAPTLKGEYLCAIFVLNTSNRLVDPDITLEEYIRNGELGDHFTWEDYSYEGHSKDNIIERIKSNVCKKLHDKYNADLVVDNGRTESGIGYKMRTMMPTLGFGTKPSGKMKSRDGKKPVPQQKSHHISYGLDPNRTQYGKDNISVTYLLKSSAPVDGFEGEIYISTAGSKEISCKDWEEMTPLNFPMNISSIVVSFIKKDNEKDQTVILVDSKHPHQAEEGAELHITNINSMQNTFYSFNLEFLRPHSFELTVSLVMHLSSKDALPFVKINEITRKEADHD